MLDKILFVATYPEMRKIASQIASEYEGEMKIISGELFQAVQQIKPEDLSGREVIVSRGGTARLLGDTFHVPVVEIEVSAYDILRAAYKHIDKKIAVIGADNVISGIKVVEEIVGLNIQYHPFTFENEIEEKLDLIRQTDIDVVVGDTVAVRIAKKRGFPVELVRSGKESVQDAINKAIKIIEAILREREKNSRVNAIVEHLNEGVIVTDENTRIVLFNRVAESLLQRTKAEALGKNITYALPTVDILPVIKSRETISKKILQIHETYFVLNIIPILVGDICRGVVITCEDVTEIQKLEQTIRQTLSTRGLVAKHRFQDIIGESPMIQDTVNLSKKYALVDSTVLIYGESGTGKELFAQSIHNYSQRKSGPFIAINCATLPPSLLESTLFGYEEGSFTGAKKGGQKGVFELAHNGTLFLDEITEMTPEIQSNLLRVLQEREVMRLGGDRIVPVNVRIIAATNKKLFSAVEAGEFRADLYYRLSVLEVDIPTLRARVQDIEILIRRFLHVYCKKYDRPPIQLDNHVLQQLRNYSWPGNVRQLENVAQKIVIQAEGGVFKERDMTGFLPETQSGETMRIPVQSGTLAEIVSGVVVQVLKEERYNKTKAADRLGITRVTLNKYLGGV